MFSQSKFTRSHNTHLSFTLCYPESFPQLSRRGLSSLSGTHPALLSHFILSALVFSHPFNNSHKPLEMRYFIMPPRCVRTECNDVKSTRWNKHTQHMVDTLLYSSAEKPRRRHCNCFCLWSAYKAWYNHSAWLIFHQTLWYYHSVNHYTMLFSQSLTQTDRNTNSVRCGELAEGAFVPLTAMPGHLGFHWSD